MKAKKALGRGPHVGGKFPKDFTSDQWFISRGQSMHGVRTASASGLLIEVFSPPWWRVDLWLRWLFRPRKVKTSTVLSNGERLGNYRAFYVKVTPEERPALPAVEPGATPGVLEPGELAKASTDHIAQLRKDGYLP